MSRRKWLLWILLTVALGGISGISFWLFFMVKILELPNFTPFLEYRPYQTLYFFDRSGERIGCLAKEYRDIIGPPNPSSLLVAKIILEVEDKRFYERSLWIDVKAIGRAIYENTKALKIVEGGSTLPQQLVKQLLPVEEQAQRSLERKVKEFVLAFRLVKNFSKDKIFTLYLNEIYLGHQRRGVEAASLFYFNKPAADLTLNEAATLAGIINSPEPSSPKKHPDRALARRNVVLAKTYAAGTVTEEDYQKALSEPLVTTDEFEKSCKRAPHAVDYAREVMREKLKLFLDEEKKNDAWFGVRVTTTIDSELQSYFQEGIKLALVEYSGRQPDLATDADGAALVIDNATAGILTMVGSSDYSQNKRNNTIVAKRQPGSAFKPIVYAALFEEELKLGRPAEMLLDLPISNARLKCRMISKPQNPEDWWEPQNFDEKKYNKNAYTRRLAIAKSINRPAVHAARSAGCKLHPRVPEMAKRLGITNPLKPYLPTALGASETTLDKLVVAYSVFANQGILREPYLIQVIEDSKGNKIYEWRDTKSTQVISPELAALMTEALRNVVQFGTGSPLLTLKKPLAAKTGTTNNFADAWLLGYDPEITFGAWIGKKEGRQSLGEGEFGAQTALPIVKYALENWYEGREIPTFLEEMPEWKTIIKNPRMFEKELQDIEVLEKIEREQTQTPPQNSEP